jgi:parallel beta-helix repeat protein
MKSSIRRILCAVISSFLLLPSAFPQGSLTPPGAPAPTMKSLDQVEARTPIDPTQPGFTLPFTITQPGSYYFTANITATGSVAGIIVAADDVRLDLNGFALTGGGGGSARGIDVPAARKNLHIYNGTTRGWAGGGVRADNATNSSLEKLRASANSGGALVGALVIGNGSLIQDCVASNNATNGIKTFSGTTVIGCTASSNGFSGFFLGGSVTISNCTAHANSIDGIRLVGNGTLNHCTASFNSGSGTASGVGSMISNCAASFNGFSGIETDSGSTVSNCAATNNSSSGIVTTSGCMVSECSAAINGGHEISALDSTSTHNCTARSNVASGIQVTTACHVFANTCDSNANGIGVGMSAGDITGDKNRIDGNSCSRNQVGVSVYGLTNLIVRNTASGNTTTGFVISAPTLNKVGPIVSGSGTITSNSPWANFE